MKKLLFIGSTVVDVIINIDHLPRTCEDVNVYGQELAMGGCAFNAYSMARRFHGACELFSPVGSGVYGDYIQKHLDEAGIRVLIPRPEKANGCCYCFVEPNGERTFVSYHGADYLFEKEWFDDFVMLEFEGKKFRAPVEYHKVLTQQYGDYMTPPPAEQQIPHHCNNVFWKE